MTRWSAEEVKARVSIENLLHHYGATLNGKGLGRCLFAQRHNHGDADPSMSVHEGRVYCWSQGCFGQKGADIFELVGLMEGVSNFPEQKRRVLGLTGLSHGPGLHRRRQIIRRFRWEDSDGRAAWHLRWEPGEPKFTWSQDPDGQKPGLGACRPSLRDLSLIQATATILLCAGERDQERLNEFLNTLQRSHEIVATTPYTGESAINAEVLRPLYGKACVLVTGDNDPTGQAYFEKCAGFLTGRVGKIRILKVPESYNDWTDWAEAGGTAGEFHALLNAATETQSSPAGEAFALTDSGNAEFFTHEYGDSVRYDHRRGRWLLWRKHRWHPDMDAEIRRLAKAAMRQRFTDAASCENLEARARLAKWAISSESRTRLEALLSLAEAEQPIADAGGDWDREPYLFGVPNGVIDLRAGQLHAGRQADRLTMSGTVWFEPGAPCPRWERFMEEIFSGDRELMAFVQRAIGYSLTGETGEQCLFLCYGTGANGKGTLVNTLARVLGDYAWNMPFSTIELHQRATIPNDLAALVGRRFVVASETNDGTRLNESRVKALTGCDPLTARFLHGEFFTFEPVAKFWLSVNHKPVVRDDSYGFWRRIRLIPFTQQFPLNPTLGDELRAEGAGILAWAVRGCLEWRAQGLNPPKAVVEATEEYERDSDPLADFLEEACTVAEDDEIGAAALFESYEQWAVTHGLSEKERLSRTMFGRKMGERFGSERTKSGKVYKGVSRRIL